MCSNKSSFGLSIHLFVLANNNADADVQQFAPTGGMNGCGLSYYCPAIVLPTPKRDTKVKVNNDFVSERAAGDFSRFAPEVHPERQRFSPHSALLAGRSCAPSARAT